MSQLKREGRYIVIKRKHLERHAPAHLKQILQPVIEEIALHLPPLECVVVESDWPEYEPTWAQIERRVTGDAPAWTGEGLPPVGTVCEWLMDGGGLWKTVEIRYLSKHTILCAMKSEEHDDPEFALSPDDQVFRLARTPEQIAAEDKSKAINEMIRPFETFGKISPATIAEYLYNEGYRKQQES